MKKIIKSAAPLLTLMVLVSSLLSAPMVSAAGTATMYLSPSSKTVKNGTSFTVNVYEDSGSDEVVGARAELVYPTSKLQYVSYTNSSVFSIDALSTSNGGTLLFDRGSFAAKTGAQLVVSVTFKAIASSGSAAISFGSGSKVVAKGNSGTDILGSTTGGNYTLQSSSTSPPPASPPPPSPTPSPSPTTPPPSPKGNTSTTSKPVSIKKSSSNTNKITGVSVSGVTDTSATINWQTPVAGTSVVKYGADKNSLDQTASTAGLTTNHSVTIGGKSAENGVVLSANTTYYYRADSIDAKGNSLGSVEGSFATSPAAGAAGLSSSAKLTSIIGGIAAGTFLLIVVLVVLRHMHRHKLEQAELARHFPDRYNTNPPQAPSPPTVFTPSG